MTTETYHNAAGLDMDLYMNRSLNLLQTNLYPCGLTSLTSDHFPEATTSRLDNFGGGNPIYELYRYVPRNRVWFSKIKIKYIYTYGN